MGIDINSLKGKIKEIALQIDKTKGLNSDWGNNQIDFSELSVFEKKIEQEFKKVTLL